MFGRTAVHLQRLQAERIRPRAPPRALHKKETHRPLRPRRVLQRARTNSITGIEHQQKPRLNCPGLFLFTCGSLHREEFSLNRLRGKCERIQEENRKSLDNCPWTATVFVVPECKDQHPSVPPSMGHIYAGSGQLSLSGKSSLLLS